MVNEIDVHINSNFVARIYESCKDVVYSALGKPALSLMCGSWGDELCSPKRLFTALGSLDNTVTPFQINYVFYDEEQTDPFTPYDAPAKYCNQEISPGSGSCSCTDCEAACTIPQFAKESATIPPIVWEIVVISTGFVVVLIFTVVSCLKLKRQAKVDVSDGETKHLRTKSSFGWKINSIMEAIFGKYGFRVVVIPDHPAP